jgi:hypothetical protein
LATKKQYLGGCLCGQIRFAANAPAMKPHTCSCNLCQKHSGSPTLMWVEFARDQVQWTGPGGKPSVWRSSEWSSRAFCKQCGSTIGAIDDNPTIALAVGAFDAPNRKELAPEFHSYVSKRPKWWGLHNPNDV